jgi:hypothetical protein
MPLAFTSQIEFCLVHQGTPIRTIQPNSFQKGLKTAYVSERLAYYAISETDSLTFFIFFSFSACGLGKTKQQKIPAYLSKKERLQ